MSDVFQMQINGGLRCRPSRCAAAVGMALTGSCSYSLVALIDLHFSEFIHLLMLDMDGIGGVFLAWAPVRTVNIGNHLQRSAPVSRADIHRQPEPCTVPEPASSYSTIDDAKRLGVSLQTVQRRADAGHLKAWKTPGGHRRIVVESAEQLFARYQTTGDIASSAPASERAAAAAAAAPTVVVVDDRPLDRQLLVWLVEKALPGAVVVAAASGFEALLAIGERRPHIVVTDLQMPHMSGLEMIRHLDANPTLRPRQLIAVSAHSHDDAVPGAQPAGVEFVSKPIDPALFVELLRAGLTPEA